MDEAFYENQVEILESLQDIAEEYLEHHGLLFSAKDYLDIFSSDMFVLVSEIAKEEGWYDDKSPSQEDFLFNFLHLFCSNMLIMFNIPLREQESTLESYQPKEDITREIRRIDTFPVHKQRSAEWFESRYNLFSASNLWKLFSTPGIYNSLIYEKCKGLDTQKTGYVNNDILMPNARNWGVKYEPVSVMVYEHTYGTKVNTNYGCIPHETLPIGASPDGIVCDETSPKYGRILEIKNIFNREIDGIPSEEYWVQIQTQLEVCRLEVCDFVETRFKEYGSVEAFLADTTVEYKGLILFFIPNTLNAIPEYKYMPLHINVSDYQTWIDQVKIELRESHILYHQSYWYLDQFSCTQVLRNDFWFEQAIPFIKSHWEVVLSERKSGFEHRAPKKRPPCVQQQVPPDIFSNVIKLGTDGFMFEKQTVFKN